MDGLWRSELFSHEGLFSASSLHSGRMRELLGHTDVVQ